MSGLFPDLKLEQRPDRARRTAATSRETDARRPARREKSTCETKIYSLEANNYFPATHASLARVRRAPVCDHGHLSKIVLFAPRTSLKLA